MTSSYTVSGSGAQLCAEPLQPIHCRRPHAKTPSLNLQIFSQPPQVDGHGITQTSRQTVSVSALCASSSCAASVTDSGGARTKLQKGVGAGGAASLSKHAFLDSPQRQPRQQHSARRIVTSLSSVTERHLSREYSV